MEEIRNVLISSVKCSQLPCAIENVKQYFNPLTAKLFNLDFHPLEVVSRWRDPQLQVSENY